MDGPRVSSADDRPASTFQRARRGQARRDNPLPQEIESTSHVMHFAEGILVKEQCNLNVDIEK